jgi:hypothetical protein
LSSCQPIIFASVAPCDGRFPSLAARHKGKEGEGKVGATVVLTVLFGPIGLIKHGKNVEIKQGTPLLVYTDSTYVGPPEP